VEEELPVIREAADRLAAARTALAATSEEQRRAIDAVAPPSEDVPMLFALLDAAAQRTGVHFATIEVTREEAGSARAPSGARVLAVGLTVRNVDYPKLKTLLGMLARSQRLLDVLSVQFAPAALTANVRLRAYTVDDVTP
jgi:hypothetical protein